MQAKFQNVTYSVFYFTRQVLKTIVALINHSNKSIQFEIDSNLPLFRCCFFVFVFVFCFLFVCLFVCFLLVCLFVCFFFGFLFCFVFCLAGFPILRLHNIVMDKKCLKQPN